ncbi:ribosome-associated translation inhibitor RaiA [Defluviimonas sp. WL0024]|uniref:Ribosome hibernation promoting factor n=2 Tax=Albidovulum TaxID=205889 RepID=A0ABT3J144_9RHOB|nr:MULTISPECIES: ribosome-associated translation inhibitor RaiA [Defluviimonas]MCU9848164.1 ribosome-associated translation inhibitor RaiA [Defluviimonas sp. WL0024]MCW3781406.1 ribosome-associated translation inhibitor RaiA [Defluviimonas salinarum]
MRYRISGKQIDVGDALQTHVKSELGETVEKFSQRPTDATVIFARDAYEYSCETTVHLSTGLTAAAKGHATDIYAAFENCREKMEKQLRRYKRRLKDHHRDRTEPVEFAGAPMYVLAANGETSDMEPDSLQPMIIAEMETRIPSLSVGEAVMQMELAGTPLLVFRNEKNGGVSVVHRRDDGNVGWIDTSAG